MSTKDKKNIPAAPAEENLVEDMSEKFDVFETWVIGHSKQLIAGCIVVIILVALFFTVQGIHASSTAKTANLFAAAKTAAELESVLKANPSAACVPEAKVRLSEIYIAEKQNDKAFAVLKELASDTKNVYIASRASLSMAYIRELEKKPDEAVLLFSKVARDPKAPSVLKAEASYGAGRLLAAKKDYAGAKQYLMMNQGNITEQASAQWAMLSKELLNRFPAVKATPSTEKTSAKK